MLGPGIELVEIIGSEAHLAGPLEAQPFDVFLDGVDIGLLFLGRVGVIEAQVTIATELLRQTEVQTDRLGVPDMQEAVGLRRETRDNLIGTAGLEFFADLVKHEVRGALGLGTHEVSLHLCVVPGRRIAGRHVVERTCARTTRRMIGAASTRLPPAQAFVSGCKAAIIARRPQAMP